jgi:hypothetical protein
LLRVTTRESLMPNGKAVPNITVAVGLGAPFDPTQPPFATARTDADGRATISIPWSAVDAARAEERPLWLRVVEPGYQQGTTTRKKPDGPGPLDVTLIAFRGCTLRGRVLDEQHDPVAAKVRVAPWLGERGIVVADLGEARTDGWFEALPFRAGTFQVLADAGVLGTGSVRDVVVSADRVPDPIEVVVRGPGVLRGSVGDGAGHPAAGLDLEMVAAAYDRAREEPPAPNAAPGARCLGELELEGRGRVQVEARTDANGRFEVRGLRDDLYVVRVQGTESWRFGARLTPQPVPSDGKPLELVLARPYLAVHVVDGEGKAWPGAAQVHTTVSDGEGQAWPKDTRVAVRATDTVPDVFGSAPSWLVGRRVADGEFVFDVATDRSYRVGLLGGNQPWRPVEVDVPPGAGRVDVRLTAAAEVPLGVLRVDVQSAEPATSAFVRVRVEDQVSGLVLVDRDDRYYDDGSSRNVLSLPEGDYRVVVDGHPLLDGWHGVLWHERAGGRLEADVHIQRGREARVTGTLPSGARLRVRVSGEATEADREAIRSADRGYTVGWPNWQERFPHRVQLLLCAAAREPIPVEFVEEWTGSSAAGKHLTPFLELGQEDVSQVLPAGRFTLEAHLPGGRVARAPVTLVDGQTTEVALTFE